MKIIDKNEEVKMGRAGALKGAREKLGSKIGVEEKGRRDGRKERNSQIENRSQHTDRSLLQTRPKCSREETE